MTGEEPELITDLCDFGTQVFRMVRVVNCE